MANVTTFDVEKNYWLFIFEGKPDMVFSLQLQPSFHPYTFTFSSTKVNKNLAEVSRWRIFCQIQISYNYHNVGHILWIGTSEYAQD